MMNDEIARANMIEQQIRPWNVLQMQTLNVLAEIRREDFVPSQYQLLSFADVPIPMGDNPAEAGKVMLEPKVGARMIEAMGVKPKHQVLEIGTGTGYLTALLATLCEHVLSIEIDVQLIHQADTNLIMAGITNVQLIHDDCFAFCSASHQCIGKHARKFDAILITGSMPKMDHAFLKMINTDGCVVGIEGDDPAMHVVVYRTDGSKQSLFETSVPRLVNADDSQSFVF